MLIRINLRASNILKISWWSMAPDPPSLVCLCKLHIHVTPLQKILTTGLGRTSSRPYLTAESLAYRKSVWIRVLRTFTEICGEPMGNALRVWNSSVNIWTGKNWMQYYAGRVGTTALLLPKNDLRSNLRGSNF